MFSFKELEEEICAINPVLDSAQKVAKRLLEENKDNPDVCAKINTRLVSVSSPLTKFSSSLTDKQGKLDRVVKAAEKYEEEKAPLEKYLEETQSAMEELEPFGVNVEAGEKQVENLQVSRALYN